MIWVILAIIVFIIVAIIFYRCGFGLFCSVFFPFLIAIATFCIGESIGESIIQFTTEETIIEEYEVSSVSQGNTATRGFIYSGFGYIGSNRVYYYYVQNSDGTTSEESILVADTTVIEDDTVTSKIQVTGYKSNKWLCLFDNVTGYVLYVPTGTFNTTN